MREEFQKAVPLAREEASKRHAFDGGIDGTNWTRLANRYLMDHPTLNEVRP
jgi:hypothetical protein